MYGSGAAEKLVGAAIEGRRDEVFLVSKVLPSNASARGTIAACEKSLARLRTDRLDCYLLHWRGSYPLEDTLAAFETLVRTGKILSWGVSNFDVDDLDEVAAIAGAGHPACNQVLYHLQQRAVEHAVLPWCAQHGTALVAYTPFGEHPRLFDSANRQGSVLHEIAAAHGGYGAPGGTGIPVAPCRGVRHSQSREHRPCDGECRCRGAAFERVRAGAYRRRISPRQAASRLAHAVTRSRLP